MVFVRLQLAFFVAFRINSVQSIIGATKKRQSTVAGVVIEFSPFSMVVSGMRFSDVFTARAAILKSWVVRCTT